MQFTPLTKRGKTCATPMSKQTATNFFLMLWPHYGVHTVRLVEKRSSYSESLTKEYKFEIAINDQV